MRVVYKTDWERNSMTKKMEETFYKVFQKLSEEPIPIMTDTPDDEDYVWQTIRRERISEEEYEKRGDDE